MAEEEKYEGRRVKKLRVALDKTINSTFSSFTEKTVANCFPVLNKTKPELMNSIHKNLVVSLSQNVKAEFDKICEERNVCSKLNQLDELIDENKGKSEATLEEAIPPPLNEPPSTLIARKKLQIKEKQKEQLSEQLIKLEEESKVIKAEIVEQQKTKRKLENAISSEMVPLDKTLKVASKWKDVQTKQWVDGMELMSGLSS